jgi:antitoxin ParD1/3/4
LVTSEARDKLAIEEGEFTMIIEISEDRARFVRSLVQEGGFASEAEVIDIAVRLLQELDEQAMLAELRREIAIGIQEADRGELAPFDPRATLERVRDRQASSAEPS